MRVTAPSTFLWRPIRRFLCGLALLPVVSVPDASRLHAAAHLCDQAAATAARETGVPETVLLALSRTETGRTRDGRFAPWPWTVNVAGQGRWFSDPTAARTHVQSHRTQGTRNIDIGCFQINFHWHANNFASIDHMLDPTENARYAAQFLSDLYAEFGNWDAAVAAFHSRTPHFAARYMERYRRIYAALPSDAPTTMPSAPSALNIASRPSLFDTRGRTDTPPTSPLAATAVRPLWQVAP